MSSSGWPLSNDAFHVPMHHPLAPEEIEAQSRADKRADKQVFTGFNRIDNKVGLINSESRIKMTISSSYPHHHATNCQFNNIRFHFHEESRLIDIYSW
ncbi:hypothetical protein TNCV_4036171 [Trichonephila clavipes]|nr:hypothetical protein TNCV_4036171 [Trichonephila clavipes]